MRNFLIIGLLVFTGIRLSAQAITTWPVTPTENDEVEVIIDVTQCTRTDMIGYSGQAYVHIGLITNLSDDNGDWRYVPMQWGDNSSEYEATRIEANKYSFTITPDIKSYFGVPDGESVINIAILVRSSDASKQTEDLFAPVYEAGLNIVMDQPLGDTILETGADLRIMANTVSVGTSAPDSISLYVDDVFQYKTTNDTIDHTIVTTAGEHIVKVVARNVDFTTEQTFMYFGHKTINITDVPAGMVDGINHIDDNTITLVLHAPNKSAVFVIGDFNNWETLDDYLMNKTPDGKKFWLTIDGLTKGTEYAFQYLIDAGIRVADPYSEKILDSWNDQYIPEETYPNLKAYPDGKTTGIVGVVKPGAEPYNWQVTDFNAPDPENLVVYEIHVQNFTEKGNIKTLTDTLDYLERLGVNAIELMPVNEFEGNISWGYNPSYYFAFDKIYGTKNDFKEFVDECHARGMAVIIDMVLNHSYSQSALVRMYWDENTYTVTADNPWYNVTSPHTCFSWGYDFDHDSPETKYFIDRVNRYWIEEYNVDGYRFDFTKGFTNTPSDGNNGCGSPRDEARISLLKRMTDSIRVVKDDAYVIFEHLADNSEEKVLADYGILMWGNMNHNYNEATMGFTSGSGSDLSWISYAERNWNEPNLVGYMESHDEERLMYKNKEFGNSSSSHNTRDEATALKRMEMAASFFFTIPGPKMVWEFGELGYDFSINTCSDGSVNDNCRLDLKPIRWDYYQEPNRYRLYLIYSMLINLKTNYGITKTTDFDLNLVSGIKKIHLNSADTNLVVVGNFNVTETAAIPSFQHTGTWYNYLTGEEFEVLDTEQRYILAPGEYYVFIDQNIVVPEYPPVSSTRSITKVNSNYFLYPNPVQKGQNLSLKGLSSSTEIINLYIYNHIGQQISHETIELSDGSNGTVLIQEDLQEGIYIYKIITKESEYSGKLIIQ